MSLSDSITCVALYGDVEDTPEAWRAWFEHVEQMTGELGLSPTHIGVEGAAFKSGKVKVLKRMRKKLVQAFEQGDSFRYLDLYCLPEDFRTASFDYDLCAYRHAGEYVAVLVDKGRYSPGDWEVRIEQLKNHLVFKEGEIFEIGRREHPIFYLSRDEPASSFESLRVIRKL